MKLSSEGTVVTPMGLSLGTHTNHGSLHVCLGYKTGLFSKEKAREFLDMYLEEVKCLPVDAFLPNHLAP